VFHLSIKGYHKTRPHRSYCFLSMLKIHCKRHYRNLAIYSCCTTRREHFTKTAPARRRHSVGGGGAAAAAHSSNSHNALVLLKNSLAMSKLLYLLRTLNCSASPLLADFDKILRTGLCTILNVDLNEDQWSAQMLASSAFLASAASTLTLQESIQPSNIKSVPDQSVASTEIVWEALSSSPIPTSNKQHTQKAWDKLVVTKHASMLQSRAQCDVDKARLLAASSNHLGDWLHAPQISSICLNVNVNVNVSIYIAHQQADPLMRWVR